MSRPARFGEPASVIIRLRVTEQQRQELRQVAQENQTNMAAMIREAVDTYVADYREQTLFRGPRNKVAS